SGIPARDRAERRGEVLEQDPEEIRDQDDGKDGITKAGAAGKVGRQVAGIHVSHGDEIPGAGERERLAPPRSLGDRDGAINLDEARGDARLTPPLLRDGAVDSAHRTASRHHKSCASSRPTTRVPASNATVVGPLNGWRPVIVRTTPGTSPCSAR